VGGWSLGVEEGRNFRKERRIIGRWWTKELAFPIRQIKGKSKARAKARAKAKQEQRQIKCKSNARAKNPNLSSLFQVYGLTGTSRGGP